MTRRRESGILLARQLVLAGDDIRSTTSEARMAAE
jgi:hypothetical protein